VRTYLTLFVSSDGGKASTVAEKLVAVGFRPVLGSHDFVYDWPTKAVTPQAVIELIDRVQGVLKGSNVTLHFMTEQ